MNVKDFRELLLEEETDEADLMEMASEINQINSHNSTDGNIFLLVITIISLFYP